MSGEKLYSMIKDIAKRAIPDEDLADLVYGVVKAINPLKIEVENKYPIFESQLYLSPLCYRNTVQVVIPGHTHSTPSGTTGVDGAVDMELVLWRALAVGDTVIMLRHSGGQSFYVLQRVGDLA